MGGSCARWSSSRTRSACTRSPKASRTRSRCWPCARSVATWRKAGMSRPRWRPTTSRSGASLAAMPR
ncbi:MAG: hypothetical protein LC136_16415 [Burkholderiales bacterium]|nr:hypothetical protein [Burkholderiales bacterium]